jgi:hypothetical protein
VGEAEEMCRICASAPEEKTANAATTWIWWLSAQLAFHKGDLQSVSFSSCLMKCIPCRLRWLSLFERFHNRMDRSGWHQRL